MSEVIKNLSETIGYGLNPKGMVVVESGHFYAQDGALTDEQRYSVMIGNQIISALDVKGLRVKRMLFVDDYHGDKSIEEMGEELATLEKWGLVADEVVSEQEIAGLALVLHFLLQQKGVLELGGTNSSLPGEWGGVQLLSKNGNGETNPVCELIDAALYLEKMGKGGDNWCVTVLPDCYREEQEKTRKILEAFGMSQLPVSCVFFDKSNGEITGVETWMEGR